MLWVSTPQVYEDNDENKRHRPLDCLVIKRLAI
jgi:hypothetical protein